MLSDNGHPCYNICINVSSTHIRILEDEMKRFLLVLVMALVLLTACKDNTSTEQNEDVVKEVEKDFNRIDIVDVEASTDDGNVAENTIDNYSDTRWSGEGDGATITYTLADGTQIEKIAIAFYQGDIRYTMFDIELSNDNTNWTQVMSGSSKDTPSLDLVEYIVEAQEAKYVRITGHGYEYFDGSKTGLWNSIVEVQFYSEASAVLDPLETSELPIEIEYNEVGLMNADGSQHEKHTPNPVTGETVVVESAQDIQTAIDKSSFGDEVFIPAGEYALYETLQLKSGVNLRGEEGTILIAKKQEGAYKLSVIDVTGASDIYISNLHLTSDFDGAFTSDHKKNNPEADGPKYVIRVQDDSRNMPSYNVTIDGLLIEKYQTMGVRIANSHDVVVTDCTFQNATDLGGGGAGYGVSIQGEGNNINRLGYSNDTRHNVVENCRFVGPYLRHGILIQYYAHNNLIENNVLQLIKLDAIDLHGEDEYLNEIRYNKIQDIETGAAIGVGNTGANHDAAGHGNYIHNNTIVNAREGIKITHGSDIDISGNAYEDIEFTMFDTRNYAYVADLLPSQVLSLVNWKINLPIENAKEVRQPDLKTLKDERFFYVTEEGNRLFVEAEGVDVGVLDADYKLGTRFQVKIKAENWFLLKQLV